LHLVGCTLETFTDIKTVRGFTLYT